MTQASGIPQQPDFRRTAMEETMSSFDEILNAHGLSVILDAVREEASCNAERQYERDKYAFAHDRLDERATQLVELVLALGIESEVQGALVEFFKEGMCVAFCNLHPIDKEFRANLDLSFNLYVRLVEEVKGAAHDECVAVGNMVYSLFNRYQPKWHQQHLIEHIWGDVISAYLRRREPQVSWVIEINQKSSQTCDHYLKEEASGLRMLNIFTRLPGPYELVSYLEDEYNCRFSRSYNERDSGEHVIERYQSKLVESLRPALLKRAFEYAKIDPFDLELAPQEELKQLIDELVDGDVLNTVDRTSDSYMCLSELMETAERVWLDSY